MACASRSYSCVVPFALSTLSLCVHAWCRCLRISVWEGRKPEEQLHIAVYAHHIPTTPVLPRALLSQQSKPESARSNVECGGRREGERRTNIYKLANATFSLQTAGPLAEPVPVALSWHHVPAPTNMIVPIRACFFSPRPTSLPAPMVYALSPSYVIPTLPHVL